jgi:hypothetical protein
MLKLAIVRVNEKTGAQKILLDIPLETQLLTELHSLHLPGFRKRNKRKVAEALRAVEDALKKQTIRLP